MRKLRTWIAIGAVLAGAGLLLQLSPRLGGFGLIALALAAFVIVAYRTL